MLTGGSKPEWLSKISESLTATYIREISLEVVQVGPTPAPNIDVP